MNIKQRIILAALRPEGLELTATSALQMARCFRDDEACAGAATRLAMTWGGMSPQAAKEEGFRWVGSILEDIQDDPADNLEIAAEFWRQRVPDPTGPVTQTQVVWGKNTADFERNRKLAEEKGIFVLVDVAPGGYRAYIQTEKGLCEPGSALAKEADPDGWLQNAARNITVLCRAVLGAILKEEGIDPEEWIEWQEDARIAEAARQGIGIDLATGKYLWE